MQNLKDPKYYNNRELSWLQFNTRVLKQAQDDSLPLLERLNAFSTEARFVYRHHWSENVLTMWDNRSVQHTAEGGYDGHRRVMHGTTVVGDSPYLAAD